MSDWISVEDRLMENDLPKIGDKIFYPEDDIEDCEWQRLGCDVALDDYWEEGDVIEVLAYKRKKTGELVAICWNESRETASERWVGHIRERES